MVITRPARTCIESGSALVEPADVTMAGRRRVLKWLIGAASAAFVASFGLPAVALKHSACPGLASSRAMCWCSRPACREFLPGNR